MERLTEERIKYGSEVTKRPEKTNKIKEKASRQSLKTKNEEEGKVEEEEEEEEEKGNDVVEREE